MPAALSDQVAVVTGASSGIGEATALALAREGAAVVLAARREDRISSLAKRIEEEGKRALARPTDVTAEDDARGLIADARDQFGRVDILVNNAGVMLLGPVMGADTQEWRTMIDVKLLGLLYCTHAALPIMAEQRSGHVVNLSSVAGRAANAGSAVYNMTKWGVGGFSEALRQEALHAGVRVTVVEPGFVATELQSHNQNPVVREAIDNMREQIGDVLEAQDIADTILFAVTRPQRMDVNEVLVRPTRQSR